MCMDDKVLEIDKKNEGEEESSVITMFFGFLSIVVFPLLLFFWEYLRGHDWEAQIQCKFSEWNNKKPKKSLGSDKDENFKRVFEINTTNGPIKTFCVLKFLIIVETHWWLVFVIDTLLP